MVGRGGLDESHAEEDGRGYLCTIIASQVARNPGMDRGLFRVEHNIHMLPSRLPTGLGRRATLGVISLARERHASSDILGATTLGRREHRLDVLISRDLLTCCMSS